MANLGALALVGAAAVAFLISLLKKDEDAGGGEGGGGGLQGEFSLSRMQPSAIQPGGKAAAFVDFVGQVTNAGGASAQVSLLMDVFIAGVFVRRETHPLFTVAGGSTTSVDIASQVFETDPAGAIQANVSLLDPAGATIDTVFSSVLGTVESPAELSLSGGFKL